MRSDGTKQMIAADAGRKVHVGDDHGTTLARGLKSLPGGGLAVLLRLPRSCRLGIGIGQDLATLADAVLPLEVHQRTDPHEDRGPHIQAQPPDGIHRIDA